MEKIRKARRRKPEEKKRKKVTITLSLEEMQALEQLSDLAQDSYGATAGRLFLRELERAQKKGR